LLGQSPFLRFVFTGGVAAGVNIGSRLALSHFAIYEIAVVLAYLLGMITAYVLAKLFVFDPSGRPVESEFIRFSLINLVALAQVWLLSVGLARQLFPAIGFSWHPETVAHVVGVLSPVITSYYGHRFFSFRRNSEHGVSRM
jgi:putative flippase GtrA